MIRPFTPHDCSEVCALWLESSISAHPFIPRAYWEAKLDALRTVYLPLSDELLLFLDDETGKLAGFMALVDSFLAALFVSPAMQGRGVGSRLLSLAKKMHPELTLSVYARNARAVAFYERHGFVFVEARVEEETGETEWIMHLAPGH